MDIAKIKTSSSILWHYVQQWCSRVGRKAARPVLVLWFVMTGKDTPRKDKMAIFVSLAYLVIPIKKLKAKQLIPIIGMIDQAMSLAMAVRKMARHITPEINQKVEAQLDKWFPDEAKATESYAIESKAIDTKEYPLLPPPLPPLPDTM